MNLFWLVRMSQWVRRPPTPTQVKLALAVAVICFVLFGIERIWGWPEVLTPNGGGRRFMW